MSHSGAQCHGRLRTGTAILVRLSAAIVIDAVAHLDGSRENGGIGVIAIHEMGVAVAVRVHSDEHRAGSDVR